MENHAYDEGFQMAKEEAEEMYKEEKSIREMKDLESDIYGAYIPNQSDEELQKEGKETTRDAFHYPESDDYECPYKVPLNMMHGWKGIKMLLPRV